MRTPTGPHPMYCADSQQFRVLIGLVWCGPSVVWRPGFEIVRLLSTASASTPTSQLKSWFSAPVFSTSRVLKTCSTQNTQFLQCKPGAQTSGVPQASMGLHQSVAVAGPKEKEDSRVAPGL